MAILNFQKPDKVIMIDSTDFEGKFEFRPLEPGYGLTVGNALRRVLLSSLEGYAITSLRVDGVEHEFSTIKGVVEDTLHVLLNIKEIVIKNSTGEPGKMRLVKQGEGPVRVADISCDIDGPIACTIRPSTIDQPIYGYDAETESEVDFKNTSAIAVMAVDNLPCELPKDSSEGFGNSFVENILPAFFNNDHGGVLNRAKMTENGKLTSSFSYLQDYVDGK